ncbi:hypothetical protein PCANC_04919 [Puccinia coronata f. sp. avenae]|uniref:Uncharacterized protein n=1 Tax=Puccinia coronata f. sp. avenae TaxID=200324 RepID=A0A2N5SVV9_9BASI|nr:hypothetical protein PCANC_14063 [Puccinia coronata f. sp. avenae]PLW54331.1 hypothetical protein PCANC_04919 [Puccinia coronata f. sp. avenae]
MQFFLASLLCLLLLQGVLAWPAPVTPNNSIKPRFSDSYPGLGGSHRILARSPRRDSHRSGETRNKMRILRTSRINP